MRKLFFLIALFLSLPLAAQVYKYTDEKGVVHYTDKPPSKNAKPANLPPLHTYAPPPTSAKPEAATPAPEAPSGGGGFQVRITAPANESTSREASSEVAVSVDVAPPLPRGYTLRYYLDGAARSDAGDGTGALLTGVERGQHSIEVALLDPQGAEVARSAPVTVYMHQPALKRPAAAPPRPRPR